MDVDLLVALRKAQHSELVAATQLENGIRTSANQPPSVTVVRAVQNVSQLPFNVAPSSLTSWSNRIPPGVVPNHFAFRLSLNASM